METDGSGVRIRGGFGPPDLAWLVAGEEEQRQHEVERRAACAEGSGSKARLPELNPNTSLTSQRVVIGLKEVIRVKCLEECLAQSECNEHATADVAFMNQRSSGFCCRARSAARSPGNGAGVPMEGRGRAEGSP